MLYAHVRRTYAKLLYFYYQLGEFSSLNYKACYKVLKKYDKHLNALRNGEIGPAASLTVTSGGPGASRVPQEVLDSLQVQY